MDFPASHGFLDDITMPALTGEELHRMRTRQPELWTRAELEALPATVRDAFLSEGIEVDGGHSTAHAQWSSRRDDVGEQEARLIFAAMISICWGRLRPRFRWHWTMHLPTKS